MKKIFYVIVSVFALSCGISSCSQQSSQQCQDAQCDSIQQADSVVADTVEIADSITVEIDSIAE